MFGVIEKNRAPIRQRQFVVLRMVPIAHEWELVEKRLNMVTPKVFVLTAKDESAGAGILQSTQEHDRAGAMRFRAPAAPTIADPSCRRVFDEVQ